MLIQPLACLQWSQGSQGVLGAGSTMLCASTVGLTCLKVILACPELQASKNVQT